MASATGGVMLFWLHARPVARVVVVGEVVATQRSINRLALLLDDGTDLVWVHLPHIRVSAAEARAESGAGAGAGTGANASVAAAPTSAYTNSSQYTHRGFCESAVFAAQSNPRRVSLSARARGKQSQLTKSQTTLPSVPLHNHDTLHCESKGKEPKLQHNSENGSRVDNFTSVPVDYPDWSILSRARARLRNPQPRSWERRFGFPLYAKLTSGMARDDRRVPTCYRVSSPARPSRASVTNHFRQGRSRYLQSNQAYEYVPALPESSVPVGCIVRVTAPLRMYRPHGGLVLQLESAQNLEVVGSGHEDSTSSSRSSSLSSALATQARHVEKYYSAAIPGGAYHQPLSMEELEPYILPPLGLLLPPRDGTHGAYGTCAKSVNIPQNLSMLSNSDQSHYARTGACAVELSTEAQEYVARYKALLKPPSPEPLCPARTSHIHLREQKVMGKSEDHNDLQHLYEPRESKSTHSASCADWPASLSPVPHRNTSYGEEDKAVLEAYLRAWYDSDLPQPHLTKLENSLSSNRDSVVRLSKMPGREIHESSEERSMRGPESRDGRHFLLSTRAFTQSKAESPHQDQQRLFSHSHSCGSSGLAEVRSGKMKRDGLTESTRRVLAQEEAHFLPARKKSPSSVSTWRPRGVLVTPEQDRKQHWQQRQQRQQRDLVSLDPNVASRAHTGSQMHTQKGPLSFNGLIAQDCADKKRKRPHESVTIPSSSTFVSFAAPISATAHTSDSPWSTHSVTSSPESPNLQKKKRSRRDFSSDVEENRSRRRKLHSRGTHTMKFLPPPDRLENKHLTTTTAIFYIMEWLQIHCSSHLAPSSTTFLTSNLVGSSSLSTTSSHEGRSNLALLPPAFTLRYLRRQPRLHAVVERIIIAQLSKRRARDGKGSRAGRQVDMPPDPSQVRSGEGVAAKAKRYFTHLLHMLWTQGCIVPADRAVHELRPPWDGSSRKKTRSASSQHHRKCIPLTTGPGNNPHVQFVRACSSSNTEQRNTATTGPSFSTGSWGTTASEWQILGEGTHVSDEGKEAESEEELVPPPSSGAYSGMSVQTEDSVSSTAHSASSPVPDCSWDGPEECVKECEDQSFDDKEEIQLSGDEIEDHSQNGGGAQNPHSRSHRNQGQGYREDKRQDAYQLVTPELIFQALNTLLSKQEQEIQISDQRQRSKTHNRPLTDSDYQHPHHLFRQEVDLPARRRPSWIQREPEQLLRILRQSDDRWMHLTPERVEHALAQMFLPAHPP